MAKWHPARIPRRLRRDAAEAPGRNFGDAEEDEGALEEEEEGLDILDTFCSTCCSFCDAAGLETSFCSVVPEAAGGSAVKESMVLSTITQAAAPAPSTQTANAA